jgi:hypothetical protein
MCFDYGVKLILMTCKFEENESEKCARYFPMEVGEEQEFERFVVRLVSEKQVLSNLIQRKIQV